MLNLTGSPRLSGKWLSWAITAASCQGFLLLGYDQGVMSGIIGANNQFGYDFGSPDTKLQGLIVSIYDIGCAAGSLFSFFAGERFGRKAMILAGGSIMIVGTIILASSTTLAQLLVGRIVTGIGNGFNSSNIPAYQSELCNAKNRGMLLSLQGTVTIIGLCIAYWLDYGLSFVDGPVQWRFPIAFQGFFAICLVLQMLSLPETPRYLMLKGETDKASQVVAKLQGKDVPTSHPDVEYVITQIATGIKVESAGGPFRYRELIQGGRLQNLRRIALACGINVMQQFTGANMINYYAPVVYANAMHLSRNLSLILGGCTSLTYLLGSCIPLFAMDRYGRRNLLMVSAAGLAACFAIAAGLLSTGSTSAAYGATAMVFVFQLFLGIGFLPVPWFYPSEVTTTRIRSKGQALASFINWMCVFAVVQITPIAIGNIGWRTFIIFACFNALWVPIVYAFFPETNGLELEDIDHLFDKGGITGGVWSSKGGRTVQHGGHLREVGLEGGYVSKEKGEKDTADYVHVT